jgi:sulfate/thiosulfate transport system permease protein
LAQPTGTLRISEPSVLPGFGITIGLTLAWVAVIVLIPLAALVLKASSIDAAQFLKILSTPRTLHALKLSFGLAFLAAVINVFFGLIVAWALTRYEFPGRRIVDAIVDVPFALPTAVAGIALANLYGEQGWIGGLFAPLGIKIAFTPFGILIALVFVGLPFIIRTVEPALTDLDPEMEQAAVSLGASRWQTLVRVILPSILPALLTGFALAFARAIGEYGSVIFIAGNLPRISEIAPVLIIIRLEEFRYADATAIATVMLAASFVLLFIINRLQRWADRKG